MTSACFMRYASDIQAADLPEVISDQKWRRSAYKVLHPEGPIVVQVSEAEERCLFKLLDNDQLKELQSLVDCDVLKLTNKHGRELKYSISRRRKRLVGIIPKAQPKDKLAALAMNVSDKQQVLLSVQKDLERTRKLVAVLESMAGRSEVLDEQIGGLQAALRAGDRLM